MATDPYTKFQQRYKNQIIFSTLIGTQRAEIMRNFKQQY